MKLFFSTFALFFTIVVQAIPPPIEPIKNLYGLKQAPRIWHQALDKFLKNIGFTSNAADPCLNFKWINGFLSMISLHVDDLAIACTKNLTCFFSNLN